jgi:hypothetical protein
MTTDGTTFRSLVAGAMPGDLTKSFDQQLFTAAGGHNWNLCAFSKAAWNGYLMTTGGVIWVDDAFDTQRRRGPLAETKTSITL